MSFSVKKFIYRLACNNVTGSVIYSVFGNKIPDLRWRGFKFTVPQTSVNKNITASLFWGFYESAEIRFIEQYLRKDLSVIELGGSIGVVSSHIASRINENMHFIIVEANPYLIEAIQENVNRHQKPGSPVKVVNAVIAYDKTEVSIDITGDNTETSVLSDATPGKGRVAVVKAINFDELIKSSAVGEYVLVCDIEGSELEILLREKESFRQCRQLFIELHTTTYNNQFYDIQQLKDIIVHRHGFSLVAEHGPVAYFSK